MTGSVRSIGVHEDRATRPGAPERSDDPVRPSPELPEAPVELMAGIDPGYAVFFAAVLPRAVAAARRITGDLAAAEDAASEALAKAYLRWPELRHVDYRDAWVLRVATNEAIGALRTQARRERLLRRQAAVPPVPMDQEDARQLVTGQIRRLPKRQREVVALRFYAGLSTEEVASTLGVSAGAVKSHLHRALQTLRTRLGTDLIEGTFE